MCPVASSDIHVEIAKLMGSSVDTTEKQVAYVKCAGTCDKAKKIQITMVLRIVSWQQA